MSDMGEGSQYAHDQRTIAGLRAELAAAKELLREIRAQGRITGSIAVQLNRILAKQEAKQSAEA